MPEETPEEKPKEPEEPKEPEKPNEPGEKPTEGQEEPSGGAGGLFGPSILMLVPAGLLDIAGLILLLFGLDDFFILDIVGTIFIGGWIYFRSQTLKVTRGAAARMGKAAKAAGKLKWLRPLLILGEFVPYVGALPCWTILVFFELQS